MLVKANNAFKTHTQNQMMAILALRNSRPRLDCLLCIFRCREKQAQLRKHHKALYMATVRVLQKRNGYITKSFSAFDVEYALFVSIKMGVYFK